MQIKLGISGQAVELNEYLRVKDIRRVREMYGLAYAQAISQEMEVEKKDKRKLRLSIDQSKIDKKVEEKADWEKVKIIVKSVDGKEPTKEWYENLQHPDYRQLEKEMNKIWEEATGADFF